MRDLMGLRARLHGLCVCVSPLRRRLVGEPKLVDVDQPVVVDVDGLEQSPRKGVVSRHEELAQLADCYRSVAILVDLAKERVRIGRASRELVQRCDRLHAELACHFGCHLLLWPWEHGLSLSSTDASVMEVVR